MRNTDVTSTRPVLDAIPSSRIAQGVVGNGSGNQTRAGSRFITLIIPTRFMARTNGADLLPSGFMFPALQRSVPTQGGVATENKVVAQNLDHVRIEAQGYLGKTKGDAYKSRISPHLLELM